MPLVCRVSIVPETVSARVRTRSYISARVQTTPAQATCRVLVGGERISCRVLVTSTRIGARVRVAGAPVFCRVKLADEVPLVSLNVYQLAERQVRLTVPDLVADNPAYVLELSTLREQPVTTVRDMTASVASWLIDAPADGIYLVRIYTDTNQVVVDQHVLLDAQMLQQLAVLREKDPCCMTYPLLDVLEALHLGAIDHFRLANYVQANEILTYCPVNYPVATL